MLHERLGNMKLVTRIYYSFDTTGADINMSYPVHQYVCKLTQKTWNQSSTKAASRI